jgi:hypothetical protein
MLILELGRLATLGGKLVVRWENRGGKGGKLETLVQRKACCVSVGNSEGRSLVKHPSNACLHELRKR